MGQFSPNIDYRLMTLIGKLWGDLYEFFVCALYYYSDLTLSQEL